MNKNIEQEYITAIQNQMKAKDNLNKALNEFFEVSRIRIEKEVEAKYAGIVKEKGEGCCNSGGCGCQ